MTIEQENLIIELFLEGKSKTEIAKIVNVERHTIGRFLKKENIESPYAIKPNQRFGKLTTIQPTDERDGAGRVKWLCKCDCGNLTVVASSLLKNGSTQSCGCMRKESIRKINFIDLTGQKFGKLTVIKEAGKNTHGDILWYCKCECGGDTIVNGDNLRRGQTKSCGCIQSVGEYEIEKLLRKYNLNYIHQYSFTDLLSQKKWPLRFDFAIFKNNNLYCLIEYQGIQHYDLNNNFHTKELEYNDAQKIKYCEAHNYNLILVNKINDIPIIIERLVKDING